MLDIVRFYTVGRKECRAWPLPAGATARDAAGEVRFSRIITIRTSFPHFIVCVHQIHTDIAKGFVKAETIAYEDLIAAGSEKAAREARKYRLEGPAYKVQDGDIMLFKFNA